jgi:hypothetical protein
VKNSFSDYLFSPLVWIQIIILFLLLTILAFVITPLGPILGAWTANTFISGLTIEGVSGSLLTQLKADKIIWDDGNKFTVSGVDLEPGLPDFSTNTAVFDSLIIDDITLELDPNGPSRKRGERVNIGDFGTAPVNLLVASGSLNRFAISDGTQTLFQLDSLS